jgi:uncharacterized protein YgbK (DUF1537 family)
MANWATDAAPAVSVGIVADDLTGANDSAVQFATRGWATSLVLVDGPLDARTPGSVLALVSDARAQGARAATASTTECVARLRDAGAARLFLKIDSTMRGSVAEQVGGALDAWRRAHPDAFALICPAYPAMGRTVEAGRLLVNGAGVETTAFGRDPVTPVPTSDMALLLPGSTGIVIGTDGVDSLVHRIADAVAGGSRVIVVNASTAADLASIADAADRFGPRCVPVGSAGLAVAMSTVWGGSGDSVASAFRPAAARRVAVVVSSLHDMSREQFARLRSSLPADGIRLLEPPLEAALDPRTIAGWAAQQLAAPARLPEVVVIRSPDVRPAPAIDDSDRERAAVAIASSLAVITEAVFDHAQVDALVLMGGEGARAVLDRFGAQSIRVTSAIREGIPIGLVEGGRADRLTVVTKAGGFGTPDSLAEIVPELLETPDFPNAKPGEN